MKVPGEQNLPNSKILTNYFLRLSNRFPTWQSLKSWTGKQPTYKLVLLAFGAIVGIAMLFSISLFLLVRLGVFGPLPTYSDLANIQNDQASEIYDQRGISIGRYYIENRVNADSSELPHHLTQALIATEDARFFKHQGIDVRSLLRVLVKSILLADEGSGGGSTISQQLAKNLYPRQEYRLFGIVINKLKEMLIARRLEKTYSKEHILRLYLNTVPFEGNAFGVKIAAQRFFNKRLDDLKVEEAAVLVGMLKGTNYYSPVKYLDRATARRNTVLSQMVKFGYLDTITARDLIATKIKLDYQPESHDLGLATYFRSHLRQEVQGKLEHITKDDGSPYNLYTDGLKIHTTLDATMQRYAENAMRDHLKNLQKVFKKEWQGKAPWFTKEVKTKLIRSSPRYRNLETKGLSQAEILKSFEVPVPMTIFDWDLGEKETEMTPLDSIKYYLSILQAGLLAVEPKSGAVKAWVGGIDHRFLQYDHVKSKRQIGSVMKPIVYAAALRSGIQPCEYFENNLVKYAEYNDWEPHNSDESYGGYYSLEGALSHSVNTIAVEVALETGLDPIRTLARDLGIDGNIPREPAIALGAVDASLWQMLGVYASFANQGVRSTLTFLERIETADGKILFQRAKPEQNRVLSPDEATVMSHFLQAAIDSGTGQRLRYEYGIAGDIAGKTGTTQNQSDGWFIGYMPGLVTGVWVGAEMPIVHFKTTQSGQGSNTALPIWGKFMKQVQGNKRTAKYTQGNFPHPSDTVSMSLDCPHYLPELPEFFDSIMDTDDLLQFSQSVGDIDTAQLGEIMRKNPRKSSESLSEYSRKIQERNQKMIDKREQKKKRKEFFDRVFGRGEN